jgi:hypothetical protein
MGCYVDSKSRILSEKNTSNNKMTTELCLAFCKGHGLKYALTQVCYQCINYYRYRKHKLLLSFANRGTQIAIGNIYVLTFKRL